VEIRVIRKDIHISDIGIVKIQIRRLYFKNSASTTHAEECILNLINGLLHAENLL
jgi:hypothetical protein